MAPSRIEPGHTYLVERDYQNEETSKSPKIEAKAHGSPSRGQPSAVKAWVGDKLLESQYLITLSPAQRLETEQAARAYIATGKPVALIEPACFPLPTLGPRLLEARLRLSEGLGFFLLRGLTPQDYSNIENIVIFVGLSCYISSTRAIQYPGGPALTHVVDLSAPNDLKEHSGKWIGIGNQNQKIPFHTDSGHTLCLYSIHSVPIGGRSRLASSRKVLETLRNERPDVISTLSQEWQWDTFTSEIVTGRYQPLLHHRNGHEILNYTRRPLIGVPGLPRREGLEPLTTAQIEALDILEETAERNALSFEFKTGDIQFVNNLSVLHAREAFKCQQPTGCRRHLLRMFLGGSSDDLMLLPESLQAAMKPLYEHNRNEEEFPWSLEPLPYILSP